MFATRIGCTAPKFVVRLGRFDWERYAVQTSPRLGEQGKKIRIPIPWPEPSKPTIPGSKLWFYVLKISIDYFENS